MEKSENSIWLEIKHNTKNYKKIQNSQTLKEVSLEIYKKIMLIKWRLKI